MKKKLAKFTAFAESLFPHEVYYLQGITNFQNDENKKIFNVILYNLQNRENPKPFDAGIDKRKYSNLKKWMQARLKKADVDQQLLAIQSIEAKVLLDQVTAADEKELKKWLEIGVPSHFYFRKIYELAQHYEHFLLIRLREREGRRISEYLDNYRFEFAHAQDVFNKLQQATADIISQYRNRAESYPEWEAFLSDVVYGSKIDGMNQYSAFIRLSLLHLNSGEYHKLEKLYTHLDKRFKDGNFYSKRILANYYANRLLYLSRYNQLNDAEKYGYLSLRYKNADYLFYLTNLGAVLLQQGKSEEAMRLMRDAFPDMRHTNGIHNKIGFMAFYLKCLLDMGRAEDTIDHADSYLKAYHKEVFKSRWQLFFVTYFKALLQQERYSRLMFLASRYKIEQLEKENRKSSAYLPTISWYIAIARFMEEGTAKG